MQSNPAFSVRPSVAGNLLCLYENPVWNISANRQASQDEKGMAVGLARPATVSEITAYRQGTTPENFF